MLRGPALPLLAEAIALGALSIAGDPTRRPFLTLTLLGAATICLCLAVRAAARVPLSTGALLGAAALLRLALVPLPPSLSSDVWRYLWDGRVAAHGGNVYALAPDDPALASGDGDDLYPRLEHREVPSVYPPLAVAAFVVPARLPVDRALLVWKLMMSLVDVGACACLLRVAEAGGWPRQRVLWYAAHPLVALEVAGSGHLEPLGILACLLVALALLRGKPAAAGTAAAAAALTKLAPFAAFPMWTRQGDAFGRTASGEVRVHGARRFLLAALGLAGLALAPAVLAAGGVPPGLATYALRWEFGGPLHEPLWRLLAAARAPEAVEHGLDLMKEWTGMHELWNRAYPWAYPQLLSRLLLSFVVAVVIARSIAWRDPVRGNASLFGGLLVCSPTVYPWYLLWVLPWAALEARAEWLWAAAAAPLLYMPALLAVPLWPGPMAALWVPFAVLWGARTLRARRR